jgi:hypothetical protein
MRLRRRIFVIGVGVIVLALGAGTGALYAYDSSRSDVIADGVTAAGVDIGGLNANDARDVLDRSLSAKVGRRIVVEWRDRRWKLEAAAIGAHLNADRMVREALAKSRTGNFVHRAFRDLRGKDVDARIPLRVGFAPYRLHKFIDGIAKQIDQKPVDAEVHPSGIALDVTPSHDGLAVQRRLLKFRILKELLSLDSLHIVLVPTRTLKPHVSTERLAAKYPAFITIDRAHYRLRFWKNLKLYKTYTIAVGRQGLETPAGEYTIDDKQVNPSWHVPNSAWAGDLAGRVIPPGPEDPIKARWMGFYNGAGIHGTDEISSLGSAASHGCIRMSIPDVEELYSMVPLHTPIYVG